MTNMKSLNGYGFDASALGGKAPEYYIQPRNLLDNSDFTNPVNQRGQTDYTSNGYTIDRWELYSGAVGLSSLGYISTTGQMYQKIAIPTDKVYTFAVKNDAGIALVTGIPANGIHSTTLGNALIKLATIGEYAEVVIEPSEGHNLVGAYWAALYEGTYTSDTLPPYVPKGYAAELAECQRYFRKSFVGSSIPSFSERGQVVIRAANTNHLCSVNFDKPMRCIPNVTIYSPVSKQAGKVSRFSDDVDIDVDTVASSSNFQILKNAAFDLDNAYYFSYIASSDL